MRMVSRILKNRRWPISLLKYTVRKNEFIKSTTTNEEGIYEFDYLEKETYYLKFVAPDEYAFTAHVPDQDELNSDVTHYNGLNTTNLISLSPGQEVKYVDAGIKSWSVACDMDKFRSS